MLTPPPPTFWADGDGLASGDEMVLPAPDAAPDPVLVTKVLTDDGLLFWFDCSEAEPIALDCIVAERAVFAPEALD